MGGFDIFEHATGNDAALGKDAATLKLQLGMVPPSFSLTQLLCATATAASAAAASA